MIPRSAAFVYIALKVSFGKVIYRLTILLWSSHFDTIAPTAKRFPLISEFSCIKFYEPIFDIELPVDFWVGEQAQRITAALFYDRDDAFL